MSRRKFRLSIKTAIYIVEDKITIKHVVLNTCSLKYMANLGQFLIEMIKISQR